LLLIKYKWSASIANGCSTISELRSHLRVNTVIVNSV